MCNIETGGYGIHHGKSVRYTCGSNAQFGCLLIKDFSHG